jgi:hypothetical protein
MANAADVRRIAASLDGTTSAPHFDRTAFKVARTYATLAPDGASVNLKLLPEEQELQCFIAPGAFSPVPNKWGQQGWTTLSLAALDEDGLRAALTMAWRHALPRPKTRRR